MLAMAVGYWQNAVRAPSFLPLRRWDHSAIPRPAVGQPSPSPPVPRLHGTNENPIGLPMVGCYRLSLKHGWSEAGPFKENQPGKKSGS